MYSEEGSNTEEYSQSPNALKVQFSNGSVFKWSGPCHNHSKSERICSYFECFKQTITIADSLPVLNTGLQSWLEFQTL